MRSFKLYIPPRQHCEPAHLDSWKCTQKASNSYFPSTNGWLFDISRWPCPPSPSSFKRCGPSIGRVVAWIASMGTEHVVMNVNELLRSVECDQRHTSPRDRDSTSHALSTTSRQRHGKSHWALIDKINNAWEGGQLFNVYAQGGVLKITLYSKTTCQNHSARQILHDWVPSQPWPLMSTMSHWTSPVRLIQSCLSQDSPVIPSTTIVSPKWSHQLVRQGNCENQTKNQARNW